jgi:hypothetical protein
VITQAVVSPVKHGKEKEIANRSWSSLAVAIARRQRLIASDKQTTNHAMDRGSY